MQGGTLIVEDGGRLSSVCNENSWRGIEVWGTKNASQLTPGTQGIVELKNGAIIENALQAICTIKTNPDGSFDWNYTGGIVKADGAVFRNNKNGVWFGPYENKHPITGNPMTNVSYFKNCTFETTNAYVNPINPPNEFVGLYMVQGIRFLGCTFQNIATITPPGTKGNGINAFDARFTVDELC